MTIVLMESILSVILYCWYLRALFCVVTAVGERLEEYSSVSIEVEQYSDWYHLRESTFCISVYNHKYIDYEADTNVIDIH